MNGRENQLLIAFVGIQLILAAYTLHLQFDIIIITFR